MRAELVCGKIQTDGATLNDRARVLDLTIWPFDAYVRCTNCWMLSLTVREGEPVTHIAADVTLYRVADHPGTRKFFEIDQGA